MSAAAMDALNARITANSVIEGFGLDTTMVLCCPFCAEPGWLGYRVIGGLQGRRVAGASCTACQRSAELRVNARPSEMSFTFVQTGGPDLPEWYRPRIPRVPPAPRSV